MTSQHSVGAALKLSNFVTRSSQQENLMLNEKQVVNEAERSLVRSAIYSLPRSWKLIGLVLIIVATYFFGTK